MADYEQMNISGPDNLKNPFVNLKQKSGSSFSQILERRSIIGNYGVIIGTGLFIIFLTIYLVSKSSQLSSLNEQNSISSREFAQLQSEEFELKQRLTQIQTDKLLLEKQNNEITNSIKGIQEKITMISEKKDESTMKYMNLEREYKLATSKISEFNEANEFLSKEIKRLSSDNQNEIIENLTKEIAFLTQKIKDIEKGNGHNNSPSAEIDSSIIKSQDMVMQLRDWLPTGNDYTFRLLYRASDDEFDVRSFHTLVKGARFTVTVIKDGITGYVFGGFTTQTWDGNGFKMDKDAFLFNLSNHEMFRVRDYQKAIYCNDKYFPVFGEGDIYLTPQETSSYFPISYGNPDMPKFYLTRGADKIIKMVDLEVFALDFK